MGILTDHFQGRRDTQDQNAGWTELWESNQSDLWDRGTPSPALIDFLEQHPELLSVHFKGRRPRALVPGCGRGYDVVMLTLHGFDVWGLEVSDTAVQAAKEYAKMELAKPRDFNFGSGAHAADNQSGSVQFVLGDFFAREWEQKGNEKGGEEKFDLIYDYTFLCAIPPELRANWASRMGELLSEEGVLVCLEFPLYKDLDASGPPWGLKGVYWDLLAEGGNGLLSKQHQKSHDSSSQDSRALFRRVMYYQPARTYEVGNGTDMLSVWSKQKLANGDR